MLKKNNPELHYSVIKKDGGKKQSYAKSRNKKRRLTKEQKPEI